MRVNLRGPDNPAGYNRLSFVLLYVSLMIASGGLFYGLQRLGVDLPGPIDAAIGFGVFGAAVWVAGTCYAAGVAGSWTQEDRKQLAFVYTVMSAVVPFALVGFALLVLAVFYPFDPALQARLPLTRIAQMVLFLSLALVAATVPLYFIARTVLAHLITVRREAM